MDGSENSRIVPPPRPRSNRKRLAAIGGVWLVVAGGSLAIASALDREPQPVCEASAPGGLPPFRLYLDRAAFPPEIAALPTAVEQVRALEDLAASTDEPARWVELGQVAQRFEDTTTAERAYNRALAVDPDSLEAKVGRIMLACGTNVDALADADRRLAALQGQNPDSQLVSFNRGMVAAYRRDGRGFTESFERAQKQGPDTDLGRLAGELLGAVTKTNP